MNSHFQPTWRRALAAIAATVLTIQFAACGGSGAGANGGLQTGTQKSNASEIMLLSDKTSLSTATGSNGQATITAVVKDANNVVLADQPVQFSTADAGSTLRVVTSKTSSAGEASATLTATSKTNRSIAVNVTSGEITRSISIPVVGTVVSLEGSQGIVFNAPTTYTVKVADAGGTPVGGQAVALTSAQGNTLSGSSVTTNGAGQATFTVTGTRAGADTITANALGASASIAVNVSGTLLQYSTPTLNQEINVGSAQQVVVLYQQNGAPQVGQQLQFTATRGTLSAASATTDATGRATVSIQSATAGISDITATAPGNVTSSVRIEFVARVPNGVSAQASPATIGANIGGSTTNASQIIARVTDTSGNPVKGVRVDFSQVTDPSNGRLEPAFATTDSSGVATVSFIAGPTPTGNNAVQIRATVAGAPSVTPADTFVTVSRQELFIRMGTGNTIEPVDATKYRMPWTVVVTDSSGNPVQQARVDATLTSTSYGKGSYAVVSGVWAQNISAWCPSEDLNENNRLDSGEDSPGALTGDGDGILDPGNVAAAAIITPNSKTDENGFADITVTYPKSFGNWTDVRLKVTITTISGTEGSDQRTFTLPILAADASNTQVAPPGTPSPFGTAASCYLPN